MKNINHIFFDLDNTLWDFDKNSREAIKHLYQAFDIIKHCNTSYVDFLNTYETINHELWYLYNLNKTTKEELRYMRFYKTFLHFGYDDLELANNWADAYLKISPYKTHLIEGAIETLEYLKPKYKLHLITNGFKEVQEIKLVTCDLKKYFEHIIISEDYGFNKPDIRIFELAQNLANTGKENCMMIGDNYEADIKGALNAGWKSVLYSPEKTNIHSKSTIQINQLSSLKGLL
jgi:putative hydrolase of the HAD superfamily